MENEIINSWDDFEEEYEGELNLEDYDRIPEDIRASMEY